MKKQVTTAGKTKYPIPPRGVVRFFGVLLLAVDVAVVVLSIMNFEALGWMTYVLIAGALGTIYFPIKAIQTGDPEWVLLDLLFLG